MAKRILLIDDDPVFAQLVQGIGAEYGLQVDAHESLSALGTVALLGQYDAALLDYHLPEVNGFEIAEYYEQFFCTIPVIMVSAGVLDPKLAWPSCVNHLLCKSSGVVAICQAVADIIHQQAQGHQPNSDLPGVSLQNGACPEAEPANFDKPRTRYFPA